MKSKTEILTPEEVESVVESVELKMQMEFGNNYYNALSPGVLELELQSKAIQTIEKYFSNKNCKEKRNG